MDYELIISTCRFIFVYKISTYRFMIKSTKKLRLVQMSNKIKSLSRVDVNIPEKGWINAIRTTLGMSMNQLAKKTKKTPQAIHKLERSEAKGKITLQSLNEVAQALEMKVVYGLIPIEGSLEDIIHQRATKLAIEIVKRTNRTMTLEDQQVSEKRLRKEVKELTKEIVDEMPRKLWD